MALPYVFANVSQLNTPELDADFNALGALVTIPCTASGTNTIALTPAANSPAVSAYVSGAPQFSWVAAASSSGAVTVNVNGVGAKKLYKNNGANQAGSGDVVSGSLYTMIYNSALDSAVGGFVLTNQTLLTHVPTTQGLVSGSGTYVPTSTAVTYIWVRMVGGGGGGGARTTNSGGNGGATTFGGWTAVAGGGGTVAAAGGAGGSGGSTGTGTAILTLFGADGGVSTVQTDATGDGQAIFTGGAGGASYFGGAGMPAATTGGSAKTNSGSGGAGGNSLVATKGGGGGGGAEYREFIMTAAQIGAGVSYSVGTAGAAGAAGGSGGGAGGAGLISILEFYN